MYSRLDWKQWKHRRRTERLSPIVNEDRSALVREARGGWTQIGFANYESCTSSTVQRVAANKSFRVVLRLIRRSCSSALACHGNLFNSGLSTADFRREKEWNANKISSPFLHFSLSECSRNGKLALGVCFDESVSWTWRDARRPQTDSISRSFVLTSSAGYSGRSWCQIQRRAGSKVTC